MFVVPRFSGYERVPDLYGHGHAPADPDIFVHEGVISEVGNIAVDYGSQAHLHTHELTTLIPGDPQSMPTTYIDEVAPIDIRPRIEPNYDLGTSSKRRGSNIHIDLLTFPNPATPEVTSATGTNLSRQLIFQAAGHRLAHSNHYLRLGEIAENLWFPGVVTAGGGYIAYESTPAPIATVLTLAWFGLVSTANIQELRHRRRDRIAAAAQPIVEELIAGHRDDFLVT
jgi:hypothetical protein